MILCFPTSQREKEDRKMRLERRISEGFRTVEAVAGIFVAWMMVNGILHSLLAR